MLQIVGPSTQKVLGVLAAPDGLPAAVEALKLQQGMKLPSITPQQIIAQNVTPELSEQSSANNYPLVYVYCNKVVNLLREKFRTFSGETQNGCGSTCVAGSAGAVRNQLTSLCRRRHSGSGQQPRGLGDGVFFDGGYEVAFGGVKHGGRNFLQIAKVSFVLEISAD